MSLVHNGIIENHAELRAELEAAGQVFHTETDTETVAQLVDLYLKQGLPPIEAAGKALRRLEGAYALAIIFAGHPDLIVAAQHGAPLAVGFGDDEMFVGSDALALAPLTRRIAYLRDGDWTVVRPARRRLLRHGRQPGRARDQADPHDRGGDRQGQLSAISWKRSCTSTRRSSATRCTGWSVRPRRAVALPDAGDRFRHACRGSP